MAINNHQMQNSNSYNLGFIDSGTTMTYFPGTIFNNLLIHFDWFCRLDSSKHCKGKRIYEGSQPSKICFEYEENKFPNGPYEYFASFPILKFLMEGSEEETVIFNWFPSEYLYRRTDESYCFAAERESFGGEIMLGGTFMRQNNFIFDIDKGRIGFVRAACNDDPNQVKTE